MRMCVCVFVRAYVCVCVHARLGESGCMHTVLGTDSERKEGQALGHWASEFPPIPLLPQSLERILTKMEKDWEGVHFTIQEYKDTGTYIMGGSDEVQVSWSLPPAWLVIVSQAGWSRTRKGCAGGPGKPAVTAPYTARHAAAITASPLPPSPLVASVERGNLGVAAP